MSDEAKFTPGPWSIEKERSDGVHFIVCRRAKQVALRIARICGSSAISSLNPDSQIASSTRRE